MLRPEVVNFKESEKYLRLRFVDWMILIFITETKNNKLLKTNEEQAVYLHSSDWSFIRCDFINYLSLSEIVLSGACTVLSWLTTLPP